MNDEVRMRIFRGNCFSNLHEETGVS